MTHYIDRAYEATRLTQAEERKLQCSRIHCTAAIDTTEPCAMCGARFCPDHLFEGFCFQCSRVDMAADEFNEGAAA